MTPFKPMLAATLTDLTNLSFPLLASYKLDGIRAVVIDGVLLSRNLKPIPNQRLQAVFGKVKFNGLDGELLLGEPNHPKVFLRTTSGVMSVNGDPDVYFHTFDYFKYPQLTYLNRMMRMRSVVGASGRCLPVTQLLVRNVSELEAFESAALDNGYEGVMVRNTDSPYKFGRGTLSAMDLAKLKRFADAEAVVTGWEEQMRNANEATTDKLGRTERSSKKAGLVGKSTLGALRVYGLNGPYKDVAFNIGTGFDDATRAKIWVERNTWVGRVVRFKYFPSGSDKAPRFPVFLGERHRSDMGE